MISNYHSVDLLDDLLLFDETLYTDNYLLFEEIELTPYADGYLLEEIAYDTLNDSMVFEEDSMIFEEDSMVFEEDSMVFEEDSMVFEEDYLLFEELFSFDNPLQEVAYRQPMITDSSFSRVYSLLEELIVHLMYGYLEEETYPERDYLVYEEIDSIQAPLEFRQSLPVLA